MKRVASAEKIDWIWFYNQGWRTGQIIRKKSDELMTVKDIRGVRVRVGKRSNGNWVAVTNKEYKGQRCLKGKTNDKHKRQEVEKAAADKSKDKRRVKGKIAKRKLRKGFKIRLKKKRPH